MERGQSPQIPEGGFKLTVSSRFERPLIYRQRLWTRITHWAWTLCLFFLLLSGLQIFMARPDLYIGHESGFAYDNTILSIGAFMDGAAMKGRTILFGQAFDTTGWLGAVWEGDRLQPKSFPSWLTIPGYRDLATGRVVHLFFAWGLAITLLIWLVASLINRHIKELFPSGDDIRHLPREAADHARLRFSREARYNALQKLSYASVLFIALPLIIATGLTMSPGVNAWAPWMLDVFGGRQTARTIHFILMLYLVLFFVVHIVMVVLAGPFNELRSMITGWYRTDPESE
ncbi:cytochrome b/b6 domain-containing protein [Aurantimonas sp. E1-2-R+4]|uniref:cytochrome b/b6 domain-containing protein n=1 Tax=Aurantimonas sp. E1-2-R+4 TaxID=3113714 RepID=UPI002F9378FD